MYFENPERYKTATPVPAYTGKFDPAKADTLFNTYKGYYPHDILTIALVPLSIDPGSDQIEADGYMQLLTDLGCGESDIAMYVIQWQFKSTPLGCITRQQFQQGCKFYGYALHSQFYFYFF